MANDDWSIELSHNALLERERMGETPRNWLDDGLQFGIPGFLPCKSCNNYESTYITLLLEELSQNEKLFSVSFFYFLVFYFFNK